jgi:hypothetical protein
VKRLRSRLRRGQAMLEYTLVTHAILVGGVAMAWPFLSTLMNALSIYYQSIYFVLNAPTP